MFESNSSLRRALIGNLSNTRRDPPPFLIWTSTRTPLSDSVVHNASVGHWII